MQWHSRTVQPNHHAGNVLANLKHYPAALEYEWRLNCSYSTAIFGVMFLFPRTPMIYYCAGLWTEAEGSLSLTLPFVLLESLENDAPSGGPLFAVLIMNEQFPPQGQMVRAFRLQKVCGCILVCAESKIVGSLGEAGCVFMLLCVCVSLFF